MRNAIVYNFGVVDNRDSQLSIMLSFVRLLKQRHEEVLRRLADEDETWRRGLRRNLQSLGFAEACLEKADLNRSHPDHPLQIAVLGPTQAGKSSAINWVLGRSLAEVSPLAGFTVHPQGFAIAVESARLDWLDAYFSQYRRSLRRDLSPDSFDSFTLEETGPVDHCRALRDAVVWDTPDFDSVDAEGYRPAVSRVAALADVVVVVVSKDKYADLSVWELIKLLAPLRQPTVVCLNKVDPLSFPALAESLAEKWRCVRGDPLPPILPIPYLETPDGLTGLPKEREAVLAELDKASRTVQRSRHAGGVRKLLAELWPDWVAPVKLEHRLHSEWTELVDEAVRDSMELYRRDYLNHPHHYETFQRALAELLTLLEIPGLGGALVTARRVVTWPLRQIMKLGPQAVRRNREAADSAETAVLRQALAHLLIRVGETLLLRRDDGSLEQAWRREIAGTMRAEKAPLLEKFDAAVLAYQRSFQSEIETTAHRLFDHLRQHPAILNGLRATRVSTDAAALAVALHTGGIGVQDFIIAPAVLSLTSLLAEGALGRYMDKAAADLKQRQMAAVEALFRATARAELARLPERLDKSRWLGISPESLRAAEALLA